MFGDDTSTTRETAFAKVAARVAGTELASRTRWAKPSTTFRTVGAGGTMNTEPR